jgi:hypothetical protein
MPLFFSFPKLYNKRAANVLSGEMVPVGGEKMWGKGVEG